MTGPEAIDLERITRVFADLDAAGKVAMCREVAEQLERTLAVITAGELDAERVTVAHIEGAIIALRAVLG